MNKPIIGKKISSPNTQYSQLKMTQPNNPLHGKTLEIMLNYLVDYYGFEKLSTHINLNCFKKNPSIKSSLKFLRQTPWARKKVEALYLDVIEREIN
jgi:uncharacterized protein (DUF2132 family)